MDINGAHDLRATSYPLTNFSTDLCPEIRTPPMRELAVVDDKYCNIYSRAASGAAFHTGTTDRTNSTLFGDSSRTAGRRSL